jgi:hypothetical protein
MVWPVMKIATRFAQLGMSAEEKPAVGAEACSSWGELAGVVPSDMFKSPIWEAP